MTGALLSPSEGIAGIETHTVSLVDHFLGMEDCHLPKKALKKRDIRILFNGSLRKYVEKIQRVTATEGKMRIQNEF
ncbi:unnamed protein product [Wuchereria bancrofti]|uniref:Uncharacterized protein n=2 Tax=Wuchereria bancrofti TaxID=6293 RepID=A0A3P7E2X3_WUCBA|nr:unnamed protein product [Wuchereria bancrofti]